MIADLREKKSDNKATPDTQEKNTLKDAIKEFQQEHKEITMAIEAMRRVQLGRNAKSKYRPSRLTYKISENPL